MYDMMPRYREKYDNISQYADLCDSIARNSGLSGRMGSQLTIGWWPATELCCTRTVLQCYTFPRSRKNNSHFKSQITHRLCAWVVPGLSSITLTEFSSI